MQGPLDLLPVGADVELRLLREHDRELDALGELPREQALHVANRLRQRKDARLEHLPPAEGQELRGQGRGAVGRVSDQVGVAVGTILGIESRKYALAVAGDRGQKVVEVVSDAAGEAADRLEPLRITELLLEAVAIVQALHLPQEIARLALCVADQRDGELDCDGVTQAMVVALFERKAGNLACERRFHRVRRRPPGRRRWVMSEKLIPTSSCSS